MSAAASGSCQDPVERIVPGTDSFVWQSGSHLARYEFARPRVAGKRVLDVATGSGYGAAVLARSAASVMGLELDYDAVEYARRYRLLGRLALIAGDACRMPFSASVFDAIVSFETLEHISDLGAFLAEVARVLRPGGELILSVPADTEEAERNPYHLHSFSPDKLARLLRREFEPATLLAQVRVSPGLLHPIRAVRMLARASGHWTRFLAPRAFEFRIVALRDVRGSESLLAVARRR